MYVKFCHSNHITHTHTRHAQWQKEKRKRVLRGDRDFWLLTALQSTWTFADFPEILCSQE